MGLPLTGSFALPLAGPFVLPFEFEFDRLLRAEGAAVDLAVGLAAPAAGEGSCFGGADVFDEFGLSGLAPWRLAFAALGFRATMVLERAAAAEEERRWLPAGGAGIFDGFGLELGERERASSSLCDTTPNTLSS